MNFVQIFGIIFCNVQYQPQAFFSVRFYHVIYAFRMNLHSEDAWMSRNSKQARYLKIKSLQQVSNPQPLKRTLNHRLWNNWLWVWVLSQSYKHFYLRIKWLSNCEFKWVLGNKHIGFYVSNLYSQHINDVDLLTLNNLKPVFSF